MVLATLIGALVPSLSFAQERQGLVIAAPLLHGTVADLNPTDVDLFVSLKKLIGYLNATAKTPFLYPNPQMGTPNEIGVWTLNHDADVALLTYPMYAAVDAVGLSNYVIPVASIAASNSVILGNAAACRSGQSLVQVLPNSLFITRNEYSPNGKLLADVLFSQLHATPALRYSGENLNLAIEHFSAEAGAQRSTLFLVNEVDSASVLGQVSGSCVLRKDIVAPWPATVVVVRKDVPQEQLQLLQAGILQLSESRETSLPQLLGAQVQGFLSEQIGHFTLLNGTSDPVLVAAKKTVSQSKVDLRAFFNLSELIQRMQDWAKEGAVSLSLTSADSRTSYALGAVSQVMLALDQQPDVAHRVFLQGTSGGAMGVLVFTLVPRFGAYDSTRIQRVLDPNTLLDPSLRFKMFTFLLTWRLVVLLFVILMLAILFHSPIILWKQNLPFKKQLAWFGLAVLAMALAYLLCPAISLEWGVGLITALFVLMIALRIRAHHIEVGPRTYLLGVCILAILLVTMRSFILRVSILDKLNVEANMRSLALIEPSLQHCAALASDDDFAACLFTQIKYPFVVSTSDIASNQQVFFYAQPEGTHLIQPPRNTGKWVNIATCPGKFLRIVAGSASFPFVFPPSTFSCGGEQFKLLDGAIYSSGTTNVATELGAATAVTFLNEPFTAQDILKTSTQPVPEGNFADYMAGVMRTVFGFNYYRDFKQNLSDIRQVIYTPPSNGFVLPNFQYFGVMKNGVNYTSDKIFELGVADASRTEKGLFVQLTSNRFTFDDFAITLAQARQAPTTSSTVTTMTTTTVHTTTSTSATKKK